MGAAVVNERAERVLVFEVVDSISHSEDNMLPLVETMPSLRVVFPLSNEIS